LQPAGLCVPIKCSVLEVTLCATSAQLPAVHLARILNRSLNGSSSPVLTATSCSYGKGKNSTPYRIKAPDPIGIKFGTVDQVCEMMLCAKFYANLSMGGFSADG